MAVTHSLTSSTPRWVDIRNITEFKGQSFTTTHTGNKDLTKLELTGRVFGSKLKEVQATIDTSFTLFTASAWTYYGTNNYSSGANFLSGNSGVYADYTAACLIPTGKSVRVDLPINVSWGALAQDVQFDIVLTNTGSGGTQVETHTFRPYYDATHIFRFIATEDWSQAKVEFKNFTWSGSGNININNIETKLPEAAWLVDADTYMVTKMYVDDDALMIADLKNTGIRAFARNVEDDDTSPTPNNILIDNNTYAMQASEDYKMVVGIKDVSLLQAQFDAFEADLAGANPIPTLPAGADPQIQAYGTEGENLLTGYPHVLGSTTFSESFEYNPAYGSTAFAGGSRVFVTSASALFLENSPVVNGQNYTFRMRCTVPPPGATSTLTVSVKNQNDQSVLNSVAHSVLNIGTDQLFTTTLSFTVPSDCSTVYFTVVSTLSGMDFYADGLMLTRDSEGTPARYYCSPHIGCPASVALETDSAGADQMYDWTSSAWASSTDNSFITSIEVGSTASELPYEPSSAFDDFINTMSWPLNFCDQPPVMADVLEWVETLSNSWKDAMRPVIQVNLDAKPTQIDWLSAYRKAGGEGDLPVNGSYRWSDSSQTEKEYTAEFIMIKGDVPIQENGGAWLGSTTRVEYNVVNTDYRARWEDSDPPVLDSFDGTQLYFNILRGGKMDINQTCYVGAKDAGTKATLTSSHLAQFIVLIDGVPVVQFVSGTPKEGVLMSQPLLPSGIPTNCFGVIRSLMLPSTALVAGDQDVFLRYYINDANVTPPYSTSAADGVVYDNYLISASPSHALGLLLPLSQLEIHHVL